MQPHFDHSIRSRFFLRPFCKLGLLVCPIWLLLDCAALCQDKTTAAKAVQPPPVRTKSAQPLGDSKQPDKSIGLKPERDDVVIVGDSKGGTHAIVADATWEDFLDWLADREKTKAAQREAYNITEIDIVGTADRAEERATLKVTLKVTINVDDEDVLVPLRMKEATPLRLQQIEGAGVADFNFDRENGLQCWLRGRGDHTLIANISVAIRKQAPRRRIQLELPRTPVSHLLLKVPLPTILVLHSDDTSHNGKRLDDKNSEIELFGFGDRLEIGWQPVKPQAVRKSSLQSSTSMAVKVSQNLIEVMAIQTIGSTSEPFKEVSVVLPAGITEFTVEGKDYLSNRVRSTNGKRGQEDPKQVVVTLNKLTKGPVKLRWTFYFDDIKKKIPLLTPLTVSGVQRQTGYLAVGVDEGFKIVKRTQKNLLPVGVGEVSEINELRSLLGSITYAYQFLKPFELSLDIEPVQPYFKVEPHIFVIVSRDGDELRVDLDATFHFSVLRGAVSRLNFEWPDSDELQWNIEQPAFEQDGDSKKFLRIEPKSGEFTQRVTAQCRIPGDDTDFTLTLPRFSASDELPAVVGFAVSYGVDANFEPSDTTAAKPLPDYIKAKISRPESFDGRLREWFLRFDLAATTLNAKASRREQDVQAKTTIVIKPEDNQLKIRQAIEYNVSFERLSQLRLKIPEALVNSISFTTEDGTALTAEPTGQQEGDLQPFRLTLKEPAIDEFRVYALFDISIDPVMQTAGPIQSLIPIVLSTDADYSSRTLEFANNGLWDASLNDNWKPQLGLRNVSRWNTTSASDTALTLENSATKGRRDALITKAAIHSRIDQNGRSKSKATYLFEERPASLTVRFPPKVSSNVAFWWYDKRLEIALPHREADNRLLYRVDLSTTPIGQVPVLTIEYSSPSSQPLDWTETHRLHAPEFAENFRILETVWEVVLPSQHHLFTAPSSHSPSFSWRRNGLVWTRQSREQFSEIMSDLTNDMSLVGSTDWMNTNGELQNAYQFTSLGTPTSMTFRSMSLPAFVLIGAGCALCVGFLLIKIPVTRHVLTFLVVAFVVALVGLWYSESVKLLLQPMILGLLLAVVAALIEQAFKHKSNRNYLSLSAASQLISQSTSAEQELILLSGLNESANDRETPEAVSASSSVSEA